MAQNIFDEPSFWKRYDKFPRSEKGEAGASEWPELVQMLPADLRGKTVLDLACGEGWFGRWCVSRGAARVDAMDISANMLSKAEEQGKKKKKKKEKEGDEGEEEEEEEEDDTNSNNNGAITYSRVDMEELGLDGGRYDVVFCGLALHYVRDLAGLLRAVQRGLAPGGAFVFSVEHPVLTAPRRAGFARTADGVDQWPVDSYFSEGERRVDWLVEGVVKQHRTLATYVTGLVAAGLDITALAEWGGTDDLARKHPDWVEGVCPRFLLVGARKRSVGSWRAVLFSVLGLSS